MRIKEREGVVAGDGDRLPRRLQCLADTPRTSRANGSQRPDRVDIGVGDDEIGHLVQTPVEIAGFAGLNEAEMALRQGDVAGPRHGAHDGNAKRRNRVPG